MNEAAELIRDLEALGAGALGAGEKGLLRGAAEVVSLAKQNTPVRTGKARRSIHVGGHPELSGDFNPGGDRGWYGDIGHYGSSAARNSAVVEIGSDLFYFKWIEFGGTIGGVRKKVERYTDETGKKRRRRVPKSKARTLPARRPIGNAVDALEGKIEEYVFGAVGELAESLGL